MSGIIKNLIFVATLGVILWFGYIVFFKDDGVTTTEVSQAQLDQQDFILQLQNIRTIDLKTNLFSDPVFISLVNEHVDIVREDAGRKNPFAPVPGLVRGGEDKSGATPKKK